jgi:2-dehydro-3-deoxyphosphooctonate aldolase (KDO 8-P synthase)
MQIRDVPVGPGAPLLLISGLNVLESLDGALACAEGVAALADRHGLPAVFKASFDKANRSSRSSFRGVGLDEGLRILEAARTASGLPVTTDVHEPGQAKLVAEVAELLQIPAFLSRQTDLLKACAETGLPLNVKKGQFMAPDDVRHAVTKVLDTGNLRAIVTERGTTFGYHDLVVDMRSFPIMREQGIPVVFDVTHSLQRPGGGNGVTTGLAQYIEPLALAGVAAGVDGVFMEVHEDPARARSDAQNALRFDLLEPLLRRLIAVDAVVKRRGAPVHG